MAKFQPKDIRNVVLCGHGGTGKTTLTDKLLNFTGAAPNHGSVDQGTSFCDFDDEEKSHKYTIESAVTNFVYKDHLINLIDTPGYADFIGSTISAMHGVETAVIVINAQAGIQVNTRRVFKEAADAGLGRIILINKYDADNINLEQLLEDIQSSFGPECMLFNVPVGTGAGFKGVASVLAGESVDGAVFDPAEYHDTLMEQIVMADDEVMEKFLEGETPDEATMKSLLAKAVKDGVVIPIIFASGKNEVGLDALLDTIVQAGVPADSTVKTAKNAKGEVVEVTADPAGPLCAQVFKTRIDPFVQKLNFIRIYSGTLKTGQSVPCSDSRKPVKLAQLFTMEASQTTPIDEAGPGYIVAVTKVEDFHTSSSIGDLVLPAIKFPTPMVSLAATPKSRGDEGKLSTALAKLCEEDSTFRREQDPQTKELVITGMTELHLTVLQEKLKRRDKVEIDTKEPKIPYRETVLAKAEGFHRHKKQSGGSGQFAEVHLRVMPMPGDLTEETVETFANKENFISMKEYHFDKNAGFIWIDSIVGGSIPGNFMPAVEKGFYERICKGVIAGYRVQNVCVEVFFGKDHPVDSNETAFRTASNQAFKKVFLEAKPALLEPIVKIDITVPNDNVGDISGDLSNRRGRPLGMSSAGGNMQTIEAEVPLAEVTTYARVLNSMTSGQGSYTMEFLRYDPVPGNIQQQIIAKAKVEEEEE